MVWLFRAGGFGGGLVVTLVFVGFGVLVRCLCGLGYCFGGFAIWWVAGLGLVILCLAFGVLVLVSAAFAAFLAGLRGGGDSGGFGLVF